MYFNAPNDEIPTQASISNFGEDMECQNFESSANPQMSLPVLPAGAPDVLPTTTTASRASSADSDSQLDPRACFNSMIDHLVLNIASSLQAQDLLSFSVTCNNVYAICDNDNKIWARALEKENKEFAKDFFNIAADIVDKQTYYSTRNVKKLALLIYKKTEWSWMNAKPEPVFVDSNHTAILHNHFSYYLPTSVKWQETANGQILRFSIWDVRSNKISGLYELGDFSFDNHSCRAFLSNDSFLVTDFDLLENGMMALQITSYKFENSKLNEIWSKIIPYENGHSCRVVASENIFVNFVDCIGHDNEENGENFRWLVEGFERAEGCKKLFSHKFKQLDVANMDGANNDDGWLTFCSDQSLIAINYKTNSKQILKEGPFQFFNIFQKQGKVLFCCYNPGCLDLFDLETGSAIWSTELPKGENLWELDFDPITNEAFLLLTNPESCVLKAFNGVSLWTVAEYPNHPSFRLEECERFFGGFVMMEWNRASQEHCLRVSGNHGTVRCQIQSKCDHYPKILKLSPFFLEVDYQFGNKIVYDFLKLKQYFQ